jgi:acyl-CoA thioester hydrolase
MRGGRPVDEEVRQLPIVDRGVVTEEDIDFNHHMNVIVHLRILTTATINGLTSGGLGYGYPSVYKCGLFSVDHHAQYLSELVGEQEYTAHVRLLAASDRSVHVMAYLRDVSGKRIAATLESLLLNVAYGTRQVAPFPDPVLAPLSELLRAHQSLDWVAKTCGAIIVPGRDLVEVTRHA